MHLYQDLNRFEQLVSEAQMASDINAAFGKLQAVLQKHRLSDVSVVTIYNGSWDAVFHLEKGAFVEAYSTDTYCPSAVLSSGSLHRLTMDFIEEFDQGLFQVVNINIGLKEFSFPTENTVCSNTLITSSRCGTSHPVLLPHSA